MSRVLSLSDLKLIPELSHFNSIQMIHPSNDDLMMYWLQKVGMDVDYAVQYIPTKHRNMQGKVVIDFQAVGELRCDSAFVNSDMCSTVERIAITSYQDRSLTQELAGMMNNTLDFNSFNDDGIEEPGDIFTEQIESDWKEVSAQLKQLEEIRDFLRGPPYGPDGSPATQEEVAAWYENKQFYEEKHL